MKRFARMLSLVMAVVMLLATPAFAAENENQRSSNYFMMSSVYLYKTSNSKFQVWFEVTAVGTMQKVGARTIKVQRSTDKVNWSTVALYEMENYPDMVASNTSGHDGYVTYTFIRGFYYRAYVELYAKNSSGTGVMDAYTSSLDLR